MRRAASRGDKSLERTLLPLTIITSWRLDPPTGCGDSQRCRRIGPPLVARERRFINARSFIDSANDTSADFLGCFELLPVNWTHQANETFSFCRVCQATPVGSSSMRSARISFRRFGVGSFHQIHRRLCVLGKELCAAKRARSSKSDHANCRACLPDIDAILDGYDEQPWPGLRKEMNGVDH